MIYEIKTSVAATRVRSESSLRKCEGRQIVLKMKEWNSRIMVARTIYFNVIKIDVQLIEIYNTHNMVRKILYT
jgi:glutamine synthetase type III